jgi:hypothetical protein
MTLIRNKYLLNIINEMKKIIDLFIDLLYIYIGREMITLNKNNSCKYHEDRTLWS